LPFLILNPIKKDPRVHSENTTSHVDTFSIWSYSLLKERKEAATVGAKNAAFNIEKITMLEERLKSTKDQALISVTNVEKTLAARKEQYYS
jgi:hypothetical protein